QLARHVIRGDSAPIARMPRVMPPAWVPLDIDDARVLRSILDLAPPARPLDGGDGGALRVIGLVRAWASSRAALQAMLRTRRRMAAALEQGVDAGRLPTRQEARAWHAADDVVQLGFAELLMSHSPLDASLNEVRKALEGERGSMEGLVAVLKETPDPDVSRVRALRAMRAEFPLQSIIAFSEYASTVTALFGMMRGDTGVGMLTAREARIASGRLTREELLTRFAPVAHGAPCPPVRERVTLLLATDLLSEGVNLQDANIVVHFDLPWNPARLAQRVGRVRRPGGAHTVHSFLLAPPAEAATLLHADARLRRKLAEAERAVGVGFDVLPALTPCSATPPPTPHDERLASASAEGVFVARLASWRRSESAHNPRGVDANGPNATQGVGPGDAVIFAGVTAPVRGWLAALDDGTLVGSLDGCPTDTGACVRQAAVFAEGIARDVQDTEVDTVLHLLNHWLEERQLAQVCGIDASQGGSLRQAVFSRLEQITRALSRHERAAHLPRIMHLRSALTKPMPLGAERALARSVANARTSDLSWLACATDIVGRLPALARRPAARRAVAVVILCAPAL
ncbi:MAG: C-terminal helicase domain-containing protein, partial [bacterium]